MKSSISQLECIFTSLDQSRLLVIYTRLLPSVVGRGGEEPG